MNEFGAQFFRRKRNASRGGERQQEEPKQNAIKETRN
jgi:hypothetical protein